MCTSGFAVLRRNEKTRPILHQTSFQSQKISINNYRDLSLIIVLHNSTSDERLIPHQMCILEETYHVPCGHFGAKRNIRACPAAHGGHKSSRGCWYSETSGMARVPIRCPTCLRCESRSGLDPFDDLSQASRRAITHKRHASRFGFQPYYPWFRVGIFGTAERRRSCS